MWYFNDFHNIYCLIYIFKQFNHGGGRGGVIGRKMLQLICRHANVVFRIWVEEPTRTNEAFSLQHLSARINWTGSLISQIYFMLFEKKYARSAAFEHVVSSWSRLFSCSILALPVSLCEWKTSMLINLLSRM